MIDNKDTAALRVIAQEIADFRKECMAKLSNDIEEEADRVVEEGYDPARGHGRGPWWADGEQL